MSHIRRSRITYMICHITYESVMLLISICCIYVIYPFIRAPTTCTSGCHCTATTRMWCIAKCANRLFIHATIFFLLCDMTVTTFDMTPSFVERIGCSRFKNVQTGRAYIYIFKSLSNLYRSPSSYALIQVPVRITRIQVVHKCDVTGLYVQCNSFMCADDGFICVTSLMYVCRGFV